MKGPSMASRPDGPRDYFLLGIPLAVAAWNRFDVPGLWPGPRPAPGKSGLVLRALAERLNEDPGRRADARPSLPAEDLLALRTINTVLRHLARRYFHLESPGSLDPTQKRPSRSSYIA